MPQDMRDAAVVAKQLLDVLAETNRLFRDHVVRLGRSSVATKAQACLEVASYRNGSVIEGYVEAELANGGSVCWLLDVGWDADCWTIEARLAKQSGDRQETLRELPTHTVKDFDSFLRTLKQVATELLALRIPEATTGGSREARKD
jgi:hypothetical protein